MSSARDPPPDFAACFSSKEPEMMELVEVTPSTSANGSRSTPEHPPREHSLHPRATGSLDELTEPVVWDVNLIDKLLYIATPIILLKCAFVLMIIVNPLDPPRSSVSCFYPAEFSANMQSTAESHCLANLSALTPAYTHDYIPVHRAPVQSLIFPTGEYPIPPVTSQLVLMAVLCFAPLLIWKSLGLNSSAFQFISANTWISKSNGQGLTEEIINTISVIIFLLSKLAAVAVCVAFLIIFSLLMDDMEAYLRAADYYKDVDDIDALCSIKVRKLGENIRNYVIACVLSFGKDGNSRILAQLLDLTYIIRPMLNSVRMWLICILVTQCANAATILALLALSCVRRCRIIFASRYIDDYGSKEFFRIFDDCLGYKGCFVGLLCVRNGYSQSVKVMLNALKERLQTSLSKQHL